MANERLHLIHVHSSVAKVPDSNADLRYGEIAVQYATDAPALYIKKADDTYAKFTPESDITVTPSGSGNVVSNVSANGHVITITKIDAVTSATGDTLVSASVNGTEVVVAATSALSQAVSEAHTHENQDVLDGITSGKVANWDAAYASAHSHSNKSLLDSYTQTEADLADSVAKKHEHTNKTILDGIDQNDIDAWDSAATNTHSHANKSVLDGIDATKVSNWDSAYSDMLTGITTGTDGTFVTTTVSTKSNKSQSVSVAVTTAATSAATSTANGLATAYETKQYVDNAITAATSGQVTTARTISAGNMLTGGGDLSDDRTISHCGVTYNGETSGTGSITNRQFTAVTKLAEDGFGHVTAATATTFTLPEETITGATGNSGSLVNVAMSTNGKNVIATVNETGLTNALAGKADTATTLAGYGITDAYTKAEVDGKVAGLWHFKGTAASVEDLPTPSSANTGDVYQIGDKEYASNGTAWIELGSMTDLSDYKVKDVDTTASAGVKLGLDASGKVTVDATSAKTAWETAASNAQTAATGYTQTNYVAKNSVTLTDGTSALAWGSSVTLGTVEIDGQSIVIDAQLPANPNVDSATTQAGHYAPADATGSTTTAGTATAQTLDWDGTFNIPYVVFDNKGHEKSVGNRTITMPSNPNTDTATTETGHYTPGTASSTAGTDSAFIRQIVLDSKKHVISVTTGTPEAVTVVDCAATITTASTTLGTVNGTALTAKIGVADTTTGTPITTAATTLATVGGTAIKAKVEVTDNDVAIGTGATAIANVAGQNITAKVAVSSADAEIGTGLTTIATVAGVNIQAKIPAAATPHTLTIAGAAASAADATYDTTRDVTITTLDCGTY